jgi:hypothetical protein
MDQMLSWRPTVQQRSKLATPLSVTATEKNSTQPFQPLADPTPKARPTRLLL